MREFLDAAGRRWDVAVGKESWGTLVLLFAPRFEGRVRRHVLAVETAREAGVVLTNMTEEELRSLLDASTEY